MGKQHNQCFSRICLGIRKQQWTELYSGRIDTNNMVSENCYIRRMQQYLYSHTDNHNPFNRWRHLVTQPPPICSNAINPNPTFNGGGVAGLFSSTAGLDFVNTATGQVNLATSTAGIYTVTNTIAASGGCSLVSSNFINHYLSITHSNYKWYYYCVPKCKLAKYYFYGFRINSSLYICLYYKWRDRISL